MATRFQVLVVDDSADSLELAGLVLDLAGYTALLADNVPHALVLARRHQPKAIVMDLCLPTMSGIEATRLLKSDPELADIPVVAHTHGLATRAAVVHRRLRDRDREAHRTSARTPAPDANPVAFFTQTATDEASELAEISGRVDLLCTGYVALVRLGNGVFDIENRLRSRERP